MTGLWWILFDFLASQTWLNIKIKINVSCSPSPIPITKCVCVVGGGGGLNILESACLHLKAVKVLF